MGLRGLSKPHSFNVDVISVKVSFILINRSFLENKDGTYSFYVSQELEKDQIRNLPGKKIKAYELKTFLKVRLVLFFSY